MLTARIVLTRGELTLDLELEVADREVVALLGPNGSGKTTTLRAIAGLEPLESGRVTLVDGGAGTRVLEDPATATFVEPAARHLGVVFQEHLLFPRLSVLDNVAFGLRTQGVGRNAARSTAREVLQRFDLADLASARPRELSGGQSQRVAVARAVATAPAALLLDEPLASLDASTRAAVRTELRRNLVEVSGPRLLVTHDPVDAAVLADRLVVLERGRVVQTGTVEEVSLRPASRFVADLVGVNLLHGAGEGTHTVRLDSGALLTLADAVPAGELSVAIRPQAIALHAHRPDGSPRNTWEANVAEIEVDRDRARVRLDGPVPATAEVTPASIRDLALEQGTAVWASVKAVDLTTYGRATS